MRSWELEDSGRVHVDLRAAIDICGELNAQGFALEVIAATLVAIPDLSDVPPELQTHFFAGLELRRGVAAFPPTAAARPLGIDVTKPFPSFHSRDPASPCGKAERPGPTASPSSVC